MADPPVAEEGGPPTWKYDVSTKLSMCFGRHPDIDEMFCTTEGINSRRLLQARQDESLNVYRKPQPAQPRRPKNIFAVLPSPTRTLYTQATYFLTSKKGIRTRAIVVVTSELGLLPKSGRKTSVVPQNKKRALFHIGDPDIDVLTFRSLESAIGHICERLPSNILLGDLDENLKNFIIDTARRHAALATKLPSISITKPVDGLPAAVKTTVRLLHLSDPLQMPEVRSHEILLELHRIPQAKCTTEISSIFESPSIPELWPAPDVGGYDEETQQHAFKVLAWISAHTIDRVFEPESLDSYVDFLKCLACLGSSVDQEIPGHGGIYGGNNLFTVSRVEAGYLISPSATVISDISSGCLPKICVTDRPDALLRAIERLETVYLTTGNIESAWEACAHRSDFESECAESDETLLQNCTCTFPVRINTVHRCEGCYKSLLCTDNAATQGSHVQILCADCAPKPDPEEHQTADSHDNSGPSDKNQPRSSKESTKAGQQQDHLKCHACYMGGLTCEYTDPSSDKCDRCAHQGSKCVPIKRTDRGDLPETYRQRRRRLEEEKRLTEPEQPQGTPEEPEKSQERPPEPRQPREDSRCHACYLAGATCIHTDPSSDRCDRCAERKSRCVPIKYTNEGELPETHTQKHRRLNKEKKAKEPKQPRETPTEPEQQQDHPKCHACHVGSNTCRYTDPNSVRCDSCTKWQLRCVPIKYTNEGELPETHAQKARRLDTENKLKEPEQPQDRPKCHDCYVQGWTCVFTSSKTDACKSCIRRKRSCRPIEHTEDGKLPQTRAEGKRQGQCHRCYVQGSKCIFADSAKCGRCDKDNQTCIPIQYTDGELPETVWQKRRRKAGEEKPKKSTQPAEGKCHRCYVNGRKCIFTDSTSAKCDRCDKDKQTCRPIQHTDSGGLPITKHQRKRRKAREEKLLTPTKPAKSKKPSKSAEGKCHACYVYGRKCIFTDSAICGRCNKDHRTCRPIQYTDTGELPETVWQKRRRTAGEEKPTKSAKGKCHRCYVRGRKCIFTDSTTCDRCDEDNVTCEPVQHTDAGELPETANERRRRMAREEEPVRKNAKIEMTRMQRGFINKLKGELSNARKAQKLTSQDADLLGSAHVAKHWQRVEELWLSDDGFPDAYMRVPRAFDKEGRPLLVDQEGDQEGDIVDPDAFGNPGINPYGPFGMVFDALNPVHVLQGSMVNHAPDNLVPTAIFLNYLRHYYAPLLLPLVALLCRAPSREEMERISEKINHLYLIAMQFAHSLKGRQSRLGDASTIDPINQQHSSGIADPEACLKIEKPWLLFQSHDIFANSRYGTSKRNVTDVKMDIERLEAFITEVEAHFDQKLPRAHGAVYLFDPATTPAQWDWKSIQQFYTFRLRILTWHCNVQYPTTCTAESLFALHCIQWLQAQRDDHPSPWLLLLLQPYHRHPCRAVSGHLAHGLQMTSGFEAHDSENEDEDPDEMETISFAFWREPECNITWEPHVWNNMKGLYDALADRMKQKLRQDLPLDNPPYWTKDQVLAHAPDIPPTQWQAEAKQKKKRTSKKSKSKKAKSKKAKSKKAKSKKATSEKPASEEAQAKKRRSKRGDPKAKDATSSSPVGNPDRGNLTNQNNICYASAVVQVFSNVPALRALVSDIQSLPFNPLTGRGIQSFMRLDDPGFAKHKDFVEQLGNSCAFLESIGEGNLGPEVIQGLMRAMRKIDSRFVEYEESDASELFSRVIEILNDIGDRSVLLPDEEIKRPHKQLMMAQDQRILEGELLRPLPDELADQRAAHHAIGFDSDADRITSIQVVEESACMFNGCPSPHGRSFQNLRVLQLEFPVSDEGYTETRAYSVSELIQHWSRREGRGRCEHSPEHGLRGEGIKKIVATPEVLVLHIHRMALRAGQDQIPGLNLDELAGFIKNPLDIERIVDLREHCERNYKLHAVLRYDHHHWLTYAFAPDSEGNLHWAKFDDLRRRVVWDDPVRPVSEQTGNAFDFMLFYVRAGAHDVMTEDVPQGDHPAAASGTSEKAISISSAAEESSDEQGSVFEVDPDDEEASDGDDVSDDEEVSDDDDDDEMSEDELSDDVAVVSDDEISDEEMPEDEEGLHIDYGNGPADPEVLAAQESEYLELSDDDSSDDSSDDEADSDASSDDEGDSRVSSDDEVDSGISSGEEDAAEVDLDIDFIDLVPEAQAYEIAAVYQEAAELITGDAKEQLLANVQRVLVAGSMLAKALEKKAQGDGYESPAESSDEEMPDQPTEEDQTSGSGYTLQQFKDMSAYAKGICLAQGAEHASLLLEEDSHNLDNIDIVRRLHMYSGYAIVMCKQLHEVNYPPHDDKPTLMKAMPWLRARTRGLRLGAFCRGDAQFLLNKNATDNFADICNMYLCGSYVTEMGWQLDDLEAAHTEHDNTVATLEARNDTLQTQNDDLESRNDAMQAQIDQLQAQLKALKIGKAAAAKADASALSGPELFEQLQSFVQQSKKFLVPGQTTTGDSEQTKMDTSDTLKGDATSNMPTEQEKQDVEMSGTAASPREIMLPDTPVGDVNDPETSPKTPPQKTKSKASAPALSPSKAAGSPKKGPTKPTKGGLPGFMGTTAAAAAKSRPPVSKGAGGRPVTPDRGAGQPAPATREEIHTGDRRRISHIPNISPPSPSLTPSKKQRQGTRKMAVRKVGEKKGGGKR